MSYALKTHGDITASIRKLAAEEIRKAIAVLDPKSRFDLADSTHTARKHFKKLRALLRFAEPEMRKDAFDVENACFREAGRKLSDLRDAQVLVSSIDKLRRHYFRGKTTPLLSLARKELARDAERALAKTADGDSLKEVAALLNDALLRVKSWRLDEIRWKQARRAIRLSYRQSRRAFRVAAKDPTIENMHEWRKRAKDFWYHTRLLRRVSPDTFAELSEELQSLTEWIGDDHDIAMLGEALQRRAASLRSAKQMETFLAMLRIRRDELQRAVFALAERLFADRPSDFARRIDHERKLRRSSLRRAKALGPKLEE